MPKPKILIVDEFHPNLMDGLMSIGYDVLYKPLIHKAEISEALTDCIGLIIRSKCYVDESVMGNSSKIQFVARGGSGMDNLDKPYLKSRDIAMVNAPEGNRRSVAEHTLAMLMSLASNLHKGDKELRSGVWDREGNRGFEVLGLKVGVIGVGNAGLAVGELLSAVGLLALGYDKYKSNIASELIVESDMNQIFEQADIVTMHVPLTEETRGLVNRDFINKFKKEIILLNLSRGPIVNTTDILNAIKSKKIKAFGTDVFENEPPFDTSEFQELKIMNNVVFSPHVGGWTVQSYLKISDVLLNKIRTMRIRT